MSLDLKIAPAVTTAAVPVAGENLARELTVRNLNAYYGKAHAVADINIKFSPNVITALIGPSGCGKSTLLRCLNRMHEVIQGAYATGEVLIDNQNIYGPGADPVRVRRRIGVGFRKPNPFPTMSG